jgi:hypothetical protein
MEVKRKVRILEYEAYRYIEVHKIVSRDADGSVSETRFIGFADRNRRPRRGEVIAPLSESAMATIRAASDEGLELEILDDGDEHGL